MSLSFTKEYFPDVDEIDDEDLANARVEVVSFLQPLLPDIDLTPGTPTGDLVVSPLALYRAASDEARSRLMSDLDLANVADGVIFSCDFVRAYMGNFSVYDVENLRAFGIVRLSFSSPDARLISRAIRFRFGTADDWAPRTTDPNGSEIRLLEAGSSHTGQADTYILAQTSATTWAVDIPVTSAMTLPVSAGTEGTATEVSDDLVGIASAVDFTDGMPPASLKDLARLARKTAFSLTAGSRESTRSLVLRNWPEMPMVSPVVPGDLEMQRAAPTSVAALQRPAVDLYLRSTADIQKESQIVALRYVQPAGGGAKVFRGKVSFLHRPSLLDSVEWSGSTVNSLVSSYRVYSQSSRSEDLYGSLHCGTRYEDILLEVVPESDDLGTSLITLTDDDEGQFALFEIQYQADPLLETVSDLLESPDYKPVGVDVLVKSGPLVFFDELNIQFSALKGTKTTLTAARTAIVEYVRSCGFPDTFRLTELHDIMRQAGAERVVKISVTTRYRPTPADRIMRDSIVDPGGSGITGDWFDESDPAREIINASTEAIVPFTIINSDFPNDGPLDVWAATERTVRFSIDPENIQFIEV